MKLYAAALLGFVAFSASHAAATPANEPVTRGGDNPATQTTTSAATRGTDANVRASTVAARNDATVGTTQRTDTMAIAPNALTPRDTSAQPAARSATVQPRTDSGGAARTAIPVTTQNVRPRSSQQTVQARAATAIGDSIAGSLNAAHNAGVVQGKISTRPMTNRVARAATDTATVPQTRVGTEYDQCKSAYFACMDQFCAMKNTSFQRCSCSDRVFDLADQQTLITEAANQVKAFNENLDTVGMTAAQAGAMKKATEGENALTADTSASKAVLQAIMNSIQGGDTKVGGKFTDMNAININFDTAAAFGINDTGQQIAANNGAALYSAIYNQCRSAVRSDCTDATLQRAVTAYLMAIEQDCNTVAAAMDANQKTMTAAIRQSGAMLDLARVQNRQEHNASDMTQCLSDVEAAITDEQVCGANYHKCLDSGQFIDITTGRPIVGVVDFWKLENLLTFNSASAITDQRLSQIHENKGFVANFVARTKKFAAPALDKCVEKADAVWADYLDKALLEIYYAQRDKVAEIRRGCMDWIASCYTNGDMALTQSMANLLNDHTTVMPDFIAVNDAMCKTYVDSCNGMFKNDKSGDIITQYIGTKTQTDTVAACRAVAQQCFDKFGGTDYVNFYNRNSGLSGNGAALTWFSLYDLDKMFGPGNGKCDDAACSNFIKLTSSNPKYASPCAQQLASIDSCKSPEMMQLVFGGFDMQTCNDSNGCNDDGARASNAVTFGMMYWDSNAGASKFDIKQNRPSGVATEVYNKIIDSLSTQCANNYGKFKEWRYLPPGNYVVGNPCIANFTNYVFNQMVADFKIGSDNNGAWVAGVENMCPRYYIETVDTASWGACLCWENGGRRSINGTAIRCANPGESATNLNLNSLGQVCPFGVNTVTSGPNPGTFCCGNVTNPDGSFDETCPDNYPIMSLVPKPTQ